MSDVIAWAATLPWEGQVAVFCAAVIAPRAEADPIVDGFLHGDQAMTSTKPKPQE